MDEGTYVEPSKETLGAFLHRWFVTYAKPNVAGKTCERYEQIVEKDIKPSIGSITLAKLTPIHIAEFYSYALTSGRKRTGGWAIQTNTPTLSSPFARSSPTGCQLAAPPNESCGLSRAARRQS